MVAQLSEQNGRRGSGEQSFSFRACSCLRLSRVMRGWRRSAFLAAQCVSLFLATWTDKRRNRTERYKKITEARRRRETNGVRRVTSGRHPRASRVTRTHETSRVCLLALVFHSPSSCQPFLSCFWQCSRPGSAATRCPAITICAQNAACK